MISIKGLPKAEVLRVLYDAAEPKGMGFLHYDPAPMSKEEAEELIERAGDDLRAEYLSGRSMKIDISGDTFDPYLYDCDNGEGTAREVIADLRVECEVPE